MLSQVRLQIHITK